MRESLTLTAGTSDKFWTVETDWCDLTVHYGRRGTKGVTKTTTFATSAEAEGAAAKQLRAKLAKGYVRAEDGAAAVIPASGDASPASSSSTQRVSAGDPRAEAAGVSTESAAAPAVTSPAAGNDAVAQRAAPHARDDLERGDIGLVGASPFTDGYRIESLPVTTFATQAPSIEDERARFEAIARAVPTQMYNAQTAQ